MILSFCILLVLPGFVIYRFVIHFVSISSYWLYGERSSAIAVQIGDSWSQVGLFSSERLTVKFNPHKSNWEHSYYWTSQCNKYMPSHPLQKNNQTKKQHIKASWFSICHQVEANTWIDLRRCTLFLYVRASSLAKGWDEGDGLRRYHKPLCRLRRLPRGDFQVPQQWQCNNRYSQVLVGALVVPRQILQPALVQWKGNFSSLCFIFPNVTWSFRFLA